MHFMALISVISYEVSIKMEGLICPIGLSQKRLKLKKKKK